MANLSRERKLHAALSKPIRAALDAYLEEMLNCYLRGTELIKERRGETSWTYSLFECDIAQMIGIMEYMPAISPILIEFFAKHQIQVVQKKAFTTYFLVTVDLEKRAGLLTQQTCLEF